MNRSFIITSNEYRNLSLLKYDGPGAGYHKVILDRIIDRLEFMQQRHSQVLAVHLIVRYPESIIAPENNDCFQYFIEEYRRFLALSGFDPHYIWVRERHNSPNPHYHLLLLLNGNEIRYYRSPDRANQLWYFVLQRNFSISIPTSGLIHIVPAEYGDYGVMLRRGDEAIKRWAVQWFSYFAKLNTKGDAGRGVREFGSSILRKN